MRHEAVTNCHSTDSHNGVGGFSCTNSAQDGACWAHWPSRWPRHWPSPAAPARTTAAPPHPAPPPPNRARRKATPAPRHQPAPSATGDTTTLTIATNGISGGKNALEADWIQNYVIPEFTKAQAAKGVTVNATYQPSGVDDEQYKSKLALDLKAGTGPDIMSIDGIWVGEFAQAGYIKPLSEVVGPTYESWDGWAQIKEPVQGNVSFQGERYGIPAGTDGRVIFFNKKLFQQAGLPADWQPTSWDDIAAAAEQLKTIDGITPLQLNAGSAMGEATTMQGILPLLVGTGAAIYTDGKWLGNTPQLRDVLGFYDKVYNTDGLGDPQLQLDAKGRDESFAEFADNKIGMLLESDYFWRSVVEPTKGVAPMADRDTAVGYALIPAQKAGSGLDGQNDVSMSGGSGYVLNPNTNDPQLAWELLTFMSSPEAIKARLGAHRADHRPGRRQRRDPRRRPDAHLHRRQGPAGDALPARARRVHPGVRGAAAGDGRRRLRDQRGRTPPRPTRPPWRGSSARRT